MTTLEILKKAKGLIEKGWIKGTYSQNKHGYSDAVQFCMVGSIYEAVNHIPVEESRMAVRVVKKCIPSKYNSIQSFNDNRKTTKKDVLAIFDKAIQSLEPKEELVLMPVINVRDKIVA